jgi:hypothetical protein
MTLTAPAKLNRLNSPAVESFTSTLFGVAGAPGGQLRFDVVGRVASAGQIVR